MMTDSIGMIAVSIVIGFALGQSITNFMWSWLARSQRDLIDEYRRYVAALERKGGDA